jgi:transcription initiation factor TFIIIB Brf1 subunit/transcription initiation factor TFIIB
MIVCPICQSRTEGIEAQPTQAGYLPYCPDCGWVGEELLVLPLIEVEIEVQERVKLREVRE